MASTLMPAVFRALVASRTASSKSPRRSQSKSRSTSPQEPRRRRRGDAASQQPGPSAGRARERVPASGLAAEVWLLTRHYLTLLILHSLGCRAHTAIYGELMAWPVTLPECPGVKTQPRY